METTNENKILILNPISDHQALNPEPWRSPNMPAQLTSIGIDALGRNMTDFVDNISLIFNKIDTNIRGYELNEIEVSIGITSTGKISLVNLGGEVSAEGCIKLVIKKVKGNS